ncbi:MAG: hypothetical protein AAB608_02490 [Patescibacteria group bacterium]
MLDMRELKPLLRQSGSIVVVEDGQPSVVIVDYGVYRGLVRAPAEGVSSQAVAQTPAVPTTADAEFVERLNKEILALKNQIEAEERALVSPENE